MEDFKAIKRMYPKEYLSDKYPEEFQAYLNAIFASDGTSLIASREFNISLKLQHASIIKIEALITDIDLDGTLYTYLVMEYVNGKTLTNTPLHSQEQQMAMQNSLQLIDALQSAFRSHLLHNDLYDSNVMFDEFQKIKLIDLDSFDELATNENSESIEDRSNLQYIQGLLRVLKNVLACGDFNEQVINEMTLKIDALINAPCYAAELKQLIDHKSFDIFIRFFDDVYDLIETYYQ